MGFPTWGLINFKFSLNCYFYYNIIVLSAGNGQVYFFLNLGNGQV